MNDQAKSCTVAPPTQCNHATRIIENATGCATNSTTKDLMLLAKQVVGRNNATRCTTNSATSQLHSAATKRNFQSCAVALPIERNYATQKQASLRNLIMRLKIAYGGDENEWRDYANDILHNWSHDLDSAINCFSYLYDQNRSVINRKEQEGILV